MSANGVWAQPLANRAGLDNVGQLILNFAKMLPQRIYFRDWGKNVRWINSANVNEEILRSACFLFPAHAKVIEAEVRSHEQLKEAQDRLVDQNFERLLMDGMGIDDLLYAYVDYLTAENVEDIRKRHGNTTWLYYVRQPGGRLLIMGGSRRKWRFSNVPADGFTALVDDGQTIYYKPQR